MKMNCRRINFRTSCLSRRPRSLFVPISRFDEHSFPVSVRYLRTRTTSEAKDGKTPVDAGLTADNTPVRIVGQNIDGASHRESKTLGN